MKDVLKHCKSSMLERSHRGCRLFANHADRKGEVWVRPGLGMVPGFQSEPSAYRAEVIRPNTVMPELSRDCF
jgi:hypothetical protein